MAKYIYNDTEIEKTYVGLSVQPDDYLQIPYNLESKFANTSALLVDVAAGDVIVSKTDDISGHIVDTNTAINFLKDNLPKDITIVSVGAGQLPFAAKVLPDGKKLYMRVHGVSAVVSGNPDNIDFVIPYNNCKLTGIEIIGGEKGDKVNLKILDTPTGTISGVANYMLNQFGFDVNVGSEYYKHTAAYDADMIKDLKIRLEYDAINSDLLPKTVYVNFVLHEVKP